MTSAGRGFALARFRYTPSPDANDSQRVSVAAERQGLFSAIVRDSRRAERTMRPTVALLRP